MADIDWQSILQSHFIPYSSPSENILVWHRLQPVYSSGFFSLLIFLFFSIKSPSITVILIIHTHNFLEVYKWWVKKGPLLQLDTDLKVKKFSSDFIIFFFFLKTMNSEFWLELILIFFAKEEHRSPFPYIATDVPFISSIWKYFWFLWTFPLTLSRRKNIPWLVGSRGGVQHDQFRALVDLLYGMSGQSLLCLFMSVSSNTHYMLCFYRRLGNRTDQELLRADIYFRE